MTITPKLSSEQEKSKTISTLLDEIATELRDAPALTDEAVSRAGIYTTIPENLCSGPQGDKK